MPDSPVILVVDDEPDVADTHAAMLSSEYTVRVAYGGREAIDAYDPETDVVLLDRRMPDVSGHEVLAAIREAEGECRVAMLTAVDPDLDIIVMEFDAYIGKPATKDELTTVVEQLLKRSAYETGVQTYFSLVTKRAKLEEEKPATYLESSERYQQLLDELRAMEAKLDEVVGDLTGEDYDVAFRDLRDE